MVDSIVDSRLVDYFEREEQRKDHKFKLQLEF